MFDIDDVVKMLEGMAEKDFYRLPSVVFVSKLRNALIDEHYLSKEAAETIVLAMDINIGEEIPDVDLDRIVDACAAIIGKMFGAFGKHHFSTATPAFLKAVGSKLTLKF